MKSRKTQETPDVVRCRHCGEEFNIHHRGSKRCCDTCYFIRYNGKDEGGYNLTPQDLADANYNGLTPDMLAELEL